MSGAPLQVIITFMSEDSNRIVSSRPQTEDGLDHALRPKYLPDLIGQDRVKENLAILIEASRQREESIDHVMFYGPPGLGKTTRRITDPVVGSTVTSEN